MNRAFHEALQEEAAYARDERNGPCRFRPNAKHYEVCPCCGGRGRVVNPSIDCQGLSAEDFAEDPEFAEAYMSGEYDIPCRICGGNRVVDAEYTEEDDARDRPWNPWNDPISRAEMLMGA